MLILPASLQSGWNSSCCLRPSLVGQSIMRARKITRVFASHSFSFGMSFGLCHDEAASFPHKPFVVAHFHLFSTSSMLTLNRRRRSCPPISFKRGSISTALSPFGHSVSANALRSPPPPGDMRVGPTKSAILKVVDNCKALTMPRRVRTPNCTHINMDRIYGRDQQCYVCGREPSIGFLYECRQDCSSPSLHKLLAAQQEKETVPEKSTLRAELEDVGLSECVIRAAEQGHYTPAQLAILKTQKIDLKQIIEDSIQRSHINNAVAKLAAFARTTTNTDGTMSSTTRDTVCTFNVITEPKSD